MIPVFETRLQPPQVASIPLRHFCTMRLDHVAPQVHFGGEHDELLLDASALFAWEVVL